MPDGDGLSEIRHIRQILADFVSQRDSALLDEHRDGKPCELFGDGSNIEHGLRRNGGPVFKVGATITLLIDQRSVLDNHDCRAGRIGMVPR